jgi:hypothetical protein
VYAAQKPFDAQSADAKMTQLWGDLTAPDVVGKSADPLLTVNSIADVVKESMITTFDDAWEVFPANRTKVIHTQGVVCQFDLAVSSDSPFTGILGAGKTQRGLIRMGSAGNLDDPLAPLFFPGMGIKFLRSGVRTGSFVALRTTGPNTGIYDFFNTTFSNHAVPASALQALQKFQQASGCINMVGLSDLCTYDQAGTKAPEPKFPFELIFEGTGHTHSSNVKKSNAQLLAELASIPPGTELFKLGAYASPTDKKNKQLTEIGTITTASQCYQTLFGDHQLFVRHQRMEEDFAQAPGWIEEMKALGDDTCKPTVGPISQWQCEGSIKCDDYCKTSGCDWTKKYNCPWQSGGSGKASDDGSVGYSCCCDQRTSETQPCGGA